MDENLARDLRQAIEDAAGGAQPEPETRYHKGDVYLSYGLRAAEFWKIMTAFRPRFLDPIAVSIRTTTRVIVDGRRFTTRVVVVSRAISVP